MGSEKPGLQLEDGKRVAIPDSFGDCSEAFFENDGLNRVSDWAKNKGDSAPALDAGFRLGGVCRPSKIICVGLKYSDHLRSPVWKCPRSLFCFLRLRRRIKDRMTIWIFPQAP